MKISARHYETGEPIQVTIHGKTISRIDPVWPETDISDLPWIAPGFFDLQINGHMGKWFANPELTPEDVIEISEQHFTFGITRLCPTLITSSHESLVAGFTAIRQACEQEPWLDEMVPGCHLEGPYLSGEDGPRGAHPIEHIRPADWKEFETLQEVSGNRICLVTIAPEVEGAIDFIKRAVDSGVVIAIGHTAAMPEQIEEAIEAGATLSTHLGNGAHGTIRRHPNYIWSQLGSSKLYASLITDTHHIPPEFVRTVIKTKTPLRTIITCDASGWAGCKPGIYGDENTSVEVLENGPIVVAGQRQLLAGSGQMTDTCVAEAIDMAGLTIAEGIHMATLNPSKLLGVEEIRLKRGSRADLMLFKYSGSAESFRVETTLLAGEVRFGAIESS